MPPQAVPQAPVPPSKKRPTVLIVILLILLLAVIGGISSCVATCKADTERTALMNAEIAIPDLVGMSPLDAENKVHHVSGGYESNWSVVFTIEGSPTGETSYELGNRGYVVVSQSPAAGERHLGSEAVKVTLDLVISAGFVPAVPPESEPEEAPPDLQSEKPDTQGEQSEAQESQEIQKAPYQTMGLEEYGNLILGDRTLEEIFLSSEYPSGDVWLCAVRPSYGAAWAGFDQTLMAEKGVTWQQVADVVALAYLNEKDLIAAGEPISQDSLRAYENLWPDIQANRGYDSNG
jgi:hypothetical protein